MTCSVNKHGLHAVKGLQLNTKVLISIISCAYYKRNAAGAQVIKTRGPPE